MKFLDELKARNVRKTLAIYLGSALTTIGVIKLFAETYSLSTSFMPLVVTLLMCGLGSAFVFAWYHGKTGEQKFQKKEILLHTMIAGVALIISWYVGPSSSYPMLIRKGETVAVLPFKNMSDSKEDEYFSDGITEDILTQLSKISSLNVISRTSVMKYKNTEKNIREIARELGATAVLEGSVRRMSNQVRITGQLIRATEDKHLWADSYDFEMKDIFAIQSRVAQSIAKELKARLSPEEQDLIRAEPTKNLEAYGLFLRARDFQNKRSLDGNKIAVELLQRAITLDSSYAAAYALLGMSHIARYLAFGYPIGSVDSGITYATKAIKLNDKIPDGFHTLGKAYEAQGKLSLALEQYNNAIELNHNYAPAHASIGFIKFGFGQLDEALVWMRNSVTLTPDVAARYVNVGTMYDFMGEDSLALQWYRRALTLQPTLIVAHWSLVYHFLSVGDTAQARWHAQTGFAESPDDVSLMQAAGDIELVSGNVARARAYYQKAVDSSSISDGPGNQLAFTLLKLGKEREAQAILDSNLVFYKRKSEEYPEDAYNPLAVGTIYAMRHQHQQATEQLRIAVERGWCDYRWGRIEPMFASLRQNSRFQEVMNNLRSRIERMQMSARDRGLMKE
jgi:TolB-like protein/Tfp pilus assembly protein PilF